MTCPTCGATTNAGDAFCEACGADLPATEAPPDAVAASANAEDGPAAEPAPATADPAPAPVGPPCPSCGAPPGAIADGYCGSCGLKQPAPRDHIEQTGLGIAAVTDRGKRHHRNEDAFAFSVAADGAVGAVVCDGVSTSVDPDEASLAAVDAALAELAANGGLSPEERHEKAFAAARAAVLAVEWTPHPELSPPSCTYLAATVEGSVVELANLGDCRAYWLPAEGEPDVLTRDDSWAAEQVESGAMTEEEAYAAEKAHSITRWLAIDGDAEWRPRRARFEAPGAGRLLLCSDGLWNYALRPDQVAAAAGEGDLPTVARRLVDHANGAGGSDNITVVVVELPRPPPPADPPKGTDE